MRTTSTSSPASASFSSSRCLLGSNKCTATSSSCSRRSPGQRRRVSACSLSAFLLLALLLLRTPDSTTAQDPIYNKLVFASSSRHQHDRPWRSHGSQQHPGQQSRSQRLRSYRPPVAQTTTVPFMSLEQFRRDPKARLYQVDFKSRKPNRRSVTSNLIALTVACFGLQVWKPAFTQWGLKLSDRILRGEQLYRLITPIFLHGGIFHLMMNMGSLGRVGKDVEKLFGPGRYLSMYMAAGVAGNVMSAIQSPNPSLGASGAVFGVVGAYFTFLTRNEWLLGGYGEAMTTSIAQTMATNLLLGLVNPQIDQWAHVGGALAGAGMAYLFGPRLYLVELEPSSGYSGRIVVDRPVLRVPRSVEAVPQAVGQTWQRLAGSVERRVGRVMFPSGNKPWQTSRPRPNYHLRRQAPNRSIKPGKVD